MGDLNEINILNRLLRVTKDGLAYEADPRHQELLARALGLESGGYVSTPGVKHTEEQESAQIGCTVVIVQSTKGVKAHVTIRMREKES